MTKKGVVISDTGVILSLAVIEKLHLLTDFFQEVFIPTAVWNELLSFTFLDNLEYIKKFFSEKVKEIQAPNTLSVFMDYGESEAVLLYKEMRADILIIDDKHAREIAESLNVRCVGTLGLLVLAKQKQKITGLRPLFIEFLKNDRYYSKKILNKLLAENGEEGL